MTSVQPQTSPGAPPTKSPYKEMRVNELEELRQRGLAKSWSKHFSQAISKVEADLALASVALQELENRKAKAKEFAPSTNEMTQLDRMYLKVADWKKQCSQKQKETVMLYGRYIAKYGSECPENLLVTPKKGKSSLKPLSTPLATANVDELAKAFDMTDIPSFLRPSEASTPAAFDTRQLQEILEEASLPDPDAPCKTFGISPKTAVTQEESDDDDSSIISGLTTLNSAVTKEVLHDVENKVLDFIKNETEHIRKLIEEEDATSKACESQASRPHSISNPSINKAENMVLEMKQILDDFKASALNTPEEKTTIIRRIERGSEGEEWTEHWDDTFQRHFYVEAKSNTTQWNMPPSVTESSSRSASSVCDSASVGTDSGPSMAPTPKVLDYEEFKPEARLGRRSTRIEKYRKNLRRQRRRRIAASIVLLAALGASFMYYKHTNPVQVENMMETATAALKNTFGEYSFVQQVTSVDAASRQNVDTKKRTKTADATDEVLVSKTSIVEFVSMMEASTKQVAVIVVEQEVALRKANKKSNWIGSFVKAFLGPPVYKEINEKCSQKGQYCGDHWN